MVRRTGLMEHGARDAAAGEAVRYAPLGWADQGGARYVAPRL